MIFENEHTTRGTERINPHYCENGKAAKSEAYKDMRECGFNIGYTQVFNIEAQLKAINQYKNIIYLH